MKTRCHLRKVVRLAAAAALAGLLAPAAEAHHIKGIPHYAYTESYPQAPTFEELRRAGPFELRFTFFALPGTKNADLALYVKDTRGGKPYAGEVTMSVYAEGESPAQAHWVRAYRNKNNIYKVGWVYETSGVYYVRVRFAAGADAADETFRIQVGESGANYWVLGAVALGVAALIAVVAVLNRGKTREGNHHEKPDGEERGAASS